MAEHTYGANANENPRVAALVLNWNGAHLLTECLESLKGQGYPHLDIFVADNGSEDDSGRVTVDAGVRFLRLGQNLGFAGGNNEAARRVDADFLLFVNNDMRFEGNFVSRLVEAAAADPTIFACDARQLDWEGVRRVHGANRLRRTASPLAFLPFLEHYQDDRQGDVLWGNGGNLLVRKRMFDTLGGFHTPLRFDLEDFDLCARAWLRGWRTVYVPEAVVYHRVAASFRNPKVAALRRRSQAANEFLVALRLLPTRLAVATVARGIVRVFWQLAQLDPREAWLRARGLSDGLRYAGTALAERKTLRRQGTIRVESLLSRFVE